MSSAHILVVDDEPDIRGLLKEILEDEGYDVTTAENAAQARESRRQRRPDLVLLDIELGQESGLAAVADFKKAKPGLRVVLVTMHSDWRYLQAAIDAGADGYLLKDEEPAQVLAAVQAVLAGERVFPRAAQALIPPAREADQQARLDALSPREREILALVAQALPNRDIAERLQLSVRTVESHRSHIMEKLAVKNSAELVRVAVMLVGPT